MASPVSRPLQIFPLLFLLVLHLSSAHAQDLLSYVDELPECGVLEVSDQKAQLTCILEKIPQSSCGSIVNATCICSDEILYVAMQDCLASTCESTYDAIEVARLEAEACNRPYRDRTAGMLAPLAIEIPAFFAVWLRLYSRWTTVHKFEADDWIMLVCGIIYTPFLIIGHVAGDLAFGVDVWHVDLEDMKLGLKLFYVDETFYLLCLALTKISMLCFFLRIFPNRPFRLATYTAIALIAASTTVFVLMQIFQCIPISDVWEGWKGHLGARGGGRCLDVNTLAYTAGGFSIAQDAIILLLPLPLLIGLNMSWRSKLGIVLMFSLGIFILITACVRLRFIVLFAKSANPTWDYTDALNWSGIEVAVSIVVTSLPAIRVFVGRVLPGFLGSFSEKAAGLSSFMWKSIGSNRSAGGTTTGTVTGREKGGNSSSSSGLKYGHRHCHACCQGREALYGDPVSLPVQKQPARLRPRLSIFNLRGGVGAADGGFTDGELELGDKIQGDVQTEIGVADGGHEQGRGGPADYMERQQRNSSTESMIHVHTTTQTRVDAARDFRS